MALVTTKEFTLLYVTQDCDLAKNTARGFVLEAIARD